jgi:lipopolysaccharide/colanic/teichoic acid biosynthesis glycosyltransferase
MEAVAWPWPARPETSLGLAVKRSLDVALSLALIVVALPLMIGIAAAIWLDSPGPVLYRTTRVGRHGKPFPMWKFRTMVADAHERLAEIAHLNVATGMVKIPDDPRVTRVGKWLRRYSLDELPQLYNIVAGHMSLVGPRPHDLTDDVPPTPDHHARLAMRPGLSGLWQVTARSDPRLETRIRCDLDYVTNWSLALDANILARTVPAVLLARGGRVAHGLSVISTMPGSGHVTITLPDVQADQPVLESA